MVNINEMKDKVSQFTDEAKDALDEGVSTARDNLAETGKKLKKSEEALVKEASTRVRSYPLSSVGIGVLIGFVLGQIFRRK